MSAAADLSALALALRARLELDVLTGVEEAVLSRPLPPDSAPPSPPRPAPRSAQNQRKVDSRPLSTSKGPQNQQKVDSTRGPAPAPAPAPAPRPLPREEGRAISRARDSGPGLVVPPAPAAGALPPDLPPQAEKRARLGALGAYLRPCTRCGLCKGRTQVVFGVGDPDAAILFVGEGPGADEDRQGEPFVGKAGQLLTKIIEAMGLRREDVYIANVVKCRPPGNRVPMFEEAQACLPFLLDQIETVRPKVLIALGSTAAKALLGTTSSIGQLRGRWHDFRGTPLLVTYHPAYLLRNPGDKRKVWEDVQRAMERLGLRRPGNSSEP